MASGCYPRYPSPPSIARAVTLTLVPLPTRERGQAWHVLHFAREVWMSDFAEKVWLLLIDKGLLAAVLALAGFGLNRALERFKAELGLATAKQNLLLESRIQFRERQ